MLKKIKHLKCEDILILTTFVNININTLTYPENDEEYKYKELLLISSNKENVNNELDVENVIDKLMFDNYTIYLNIKEKIKNIEIDEEDIEDIENREKFIESKNNIIKYIKLFEKIIFETKFEYPDIRSIQKYLLMEKMEIEIKKENYETCSKIKKLINEI